jgi:hypothetical protein
MVKYYDCFFAVLYYAGRIDGAEDDNFFYLQKRNANINRHLCHDGFSRSICFQWDYHALALILLLTILNNGNLINK